MRYRQTPTQSGELLRQVIPYMGRHGGVYSPVHYAVWYEYLAETHAKLKEAIDSRLAAHPTLTAADAEQLYLKYIAGRELEQSERLQEGLQGLLQQLGAVAESAGHEASDFGRHLAEAAGQLQPGIDPTRLPQLIEQLASHTATVQESTRRLQQRLDDSSAEVAALKDQLGQIKSEAQTDPLTRLLNRRGFDRSVASLRTERSGQLTGCSLLMADIDHFKRVNDTYGHLLGDQVIKGVAQVIHKTIKGGDIAARFGGEEFAILLPATELESACRVAEHLRQGVTRLRVRRVGSDQVLDGISISLGVALAIDDEAMEAFIERADQALYRAKQGGRNRVEPERQAG